MLISAAAVAGTLGGWVAMAAEDNPTSLMQAQAPIISTVQVSAQNDVDTNRVVDGFAPAAQNPVPLVMTRSSR